VELVEVKEKQTSKFQLNVDVLHISFISRSFSKVRREFLLCYFETVEFLMVEQGDQVDLQLRV